MGNNTVESGEGGKTKSPLFSNGTPEMERQKNVGAVEGPTKPGNCDTSNATVHTFEK